jgi:hypothetical protein
MNARAALSAALPVALLANTRAVLERYGLVCWADSQTRADLTGGVSTFVAPAATRETAFCLTLRLRIEPLCATQAQCSCAAALAPVHNGQPQADGATLLARQKRVRAERNGALTREQMQATLAVCLQSFTPEVLAQRVHETLGDSGY